MSSLIILIILIVIFISYFYLKNPQTSKQITNNKKSNKESNNSKTENKNKNSSENKTSNENKSKTSEKITDKSTKDSSEKSEKEVVKSPPDNKSEIIDREIVDCKGEWSDWSSCTVVPCNETSKKSRVYNISQIPNKLGEECPYDDKTTEYIDCPIQPCPVDCEGEWSSYETCPDTCIVQGENGHTVRRKFNIIKDELHGGRCESRNQIETSNCPIEYCDSDCKGEWGDWNSNCPSDCIEDNNYGPTISRKFNLSEISKTNSNCINLKNKIQTSNCPFEYCPVDCEGEWLTVDSCPSSCIEEGGKRYSISKTFQVNQQERHGGECPLRGNIETSNCPIEYCPVDCKGEWPSFDSSSCSDSCVNEGETNSITRTYKVTESERHGGNCALRGNIETSNCPVQYCPVDCKGEWPSFDSSCPDSCVNTDDEIRSVSRTYNVTENERHGGECPLRDNVETSNCPLEYCPVDCIGEWGEWDKCSDNCLPYGESPHYISKTYNVVEDEKYGGKCELRGEIKTSNCPVKYCPIDCTGEWSKWDYLCPTSCINEGEKPNVVTRKFNLFKKAKFNGECSELKNSVQKSNCPLEYCPVDCKGEWSKWDDCPDTCINIGENGHKVSRIYQVNQDERYGGECLLRDNVEYSNCPIEYCPIDCEGEWGNWQTCSNLCNSNQEISRIYNVTTSNQYGGLRCDDNNGYKETSNCPFVNCPIDCEGEWGDYDKCINECGSNYQVNRTYKITTSNQYGGEFCKDDQNAYIYDGDEDFNSNCPFVNCPIDCEGEWPPFESCPDTCINKNDPNPTVTRKYNILKSSQYGGLECPLKNETESSNCPIKYCPIDCEGEWTDWTTCTNECEKQGVSTRTFNIVTSNEFGGEFCRYKNSYIDNGTKETSNCPYVKCPIDCEGKWSEWDRCYNQCGQTQETKRVYIVTSSNQYNGKSCDNAQGDTESSNCPFIKCPVDCVGEWSDWSECTNQCDERQQTHRKYIMTTSNEFGGEYCKYNDKVIFDSNLQTSNCPFEECPINCHGKWSAWDKCPNECYPEDYKGKGKQINRRYIIHTKANETGECPLKGKVQTSNCPVKFCPIDCEGNWDAWDECPTDCININDEKPTTSRKFNITKNAKFGGVQCSNVNGHVETSNCPFVTCPIDCKGRWGNWDDCTNRCDETGVTQRVYNVTTSNQYNGDYCRNEKNDILFDNDIEKSNCPFKNCSINCEGEWGVWQTCPDTCMNIYDDIKKVKRFYNIYKESEYGGSNCGYEHNDTQESNCPKNYCPIDCESRWTNWEICSNQCNSNQEISRTFIVMASNQYNGYDCDHNDGFKERSNCPFVNCPIDCEGGWSDWGECRNRCGERSITTREYTITKSNQYGGKLCKDERGNIMKRNIIESSNCPFKQCSVDCEGEWSEWDSCPTYCLNENELPFTSFRYYDIYKSKKFKGKDCPNEQNDFEESNCPINYCPIDCEGQWTEWNSECRNECNRNQEVSRTYYLTKSNQYGGYNCSYDYRDVYDGDVEKVIALL